MNDIKAALLVGGLGTRLRSVVSSTPKVLASIGERSFLELLVRQLQAQGVRHLVMCTGYLSEQIESKFGDGQSWGVSIEYSKEEIRLGTAGALRLAQGYLRECSEFLVLNGDSFLEIDFQTLVAFHRHHESAVATMAVVPVEHAGRYGSVHVDQNGRVRAFAEKTESDTPGLVNAGVYVFSQALWEYIPQGEVSLEKDVFPRLVDNGIYAQLQRGIFIDIGTPVDYARAQQLLQSYS